jgi:ubiquinone/menaquinone biosynthesis C-methylase UbiE
LYEGEFLRLLREKHERHDRPFELSKVTFVRSDAQAQIFRDGMFDFVFSFNMFEHVPDPAVAMAEVIRVVKPGGVFYLQFDPIWTSPEGNHFSHRVPDPWAHLLCSSEDFVEKMRNAGAEEWEVSDFLNALNRWSFRSFQNLLQSVENSKAARVERVEYWATTREEEPRSGHPNFARLLTLGYSEQDLVVRGIRICGRKSPETQT